MSPSSQPPRRAVRETTSLVARTVAAGGAAASPEPDLLTMGYRVVGWLRWLLVAQAAVTNLLRVHTVHHPRVMLAATAAMILWTLAMNRLNQTTRFRTALVALADLAFTLVLILASPWVIGPVQLGFLALPVYWGLVAPMGVAVWGGFRAGLLAGALAGLALGIMDTHWGAAEVALILVNPVAAGAIGMLMDGIRQVIVERDEQQATSAAIAERERLSRIVHDGTLQVLALVEREGRTLGPRGVRLAKLASAQEAKLRTLLQDRSVGPETTPERIDIAAMLDRHQSEVLTVSAMADQVLVAAHDARELDLAVSELITNVVKHAGPDAHAWLLVEQVGGDLVVWFRDDGVGMSAAQVDAARRQGRMGITGSVAGRMESLGGSAVVTSRPGKGVEWELRMPA